ncbi:MAG: hypothetical protein IKQ91_10280 [Oscillospiraceae bacterium]|nr:hypothetical protein [Oscillospiraceae bacterium]
MPNTDLPEELNQPADELPQDDQKLDRRTAIAQARAIRREAAVLHESEKAQAAETANIILENAEPEPPKAPLHKQTEPVPVSNATGKFSWLDEIKKPETPRADADEIVAQLLKESKERADAQKNQEPERVLSPEEPAAPEADAEPDALPADASEDRIAEDADAPAESPAPLPEKSAEEQVIRELRRFSGQNPTMSAAEASKQYRRLTADAKPRVRKMARKTDRAWRKEAGSIRAENTEKRVARTAAKWNIAVCLVLLFGIAAGMLIFERPTVSMEENRTLAKMPEWSVESYLSGKYTSGVAEYYNDTVPFRSTLKGWVQNIRKYMGLSSSAVIHGNMQAIPADQNADSEADPAAAVTTTAAAVTTAPAAGGSLTALTALTTVAETTTAAAEEQADEPEREGEISNNILIVNKRGIMLFGGWETMGENYARILNRYKTEMPDINMYSLVVPTVCSYYTPEEFQYLITSEKANIDYINKTLVDVVPVDVYGTLEKHKDEPVFMRTDHHWSGLGAFYAAEALSADARVPFAPIDEYEKHSKDDYVGTLYGFSNDIILKENPEEFFWYVPKANFRTTFYNNSFGNPYEADFFMNLDNCAPVSYYMVYMTGDDHIVHLETDVHNGRNICVIKDSYGNALIPWLTSSFENIYVVDMRYFQLNIKDFLRQHGMTDIAFCMNTFSANGDNAQKMEDILVQ